MAYEIRTSANRFPCGVNCDSVAANMEQGPIRCFAAEGVLEGMPHPSGAKAERIKFFVGLKLKVELSRQTRPAVIELAREKLLLQVARLRIA
jgi:hypothetical protein